MLAKSLDLYALLTMLRNIVLVSALICSVCAMHVEYLKVDSEKDLLGDDLDVDLPMLKVEMMLPSGCWTCKWVVKTVKKQLSDDSKADQIKEQLENVCGKIGFLKSKCRSMIRKYLDVLIEELSTTDDPRTICANIKLCKQKAILDIKHPHDYQKL